MGEEDQADDLEQEPGLSAPAFHAVFLYIDSRESFYLLRKKKYSKKKTI